VKPVYKVVNGLEFNSEKHQYRHGGKVRVGLTSLLANYGFGVNRFYTGAGRELGTNLHTLCQFLAEGDLDWDTVDPLNLAQLKNYERFLSDTQFKPEILEVPFYGPEIQVATKPDQVGMMAKWLSLVEIKRGVRLDYHELQTAGQKIILAENGVKVVNRFGLYLGEKNYRLIRHENDAQDAASFHVLARAYHDPEYAARNLTAIEAIKRTYGGTK